MHAATHKCTVCVAVRNACCFKSRACLMQRQDGCELQVTGRKNLGGAVLEGGQQRSHIKLASLIDEVQQASEVHAITL